MNVTRGVCIGKQAIECLPIAENHQFSLINSLSIAAVCPGSAEQVCWDKSGVCRCVWTLTTGIGGARSGGGL